MAGETKVTRIKAKDTSEKAVKATKKTVKNEDEPKKTRKKNPFLRALSGIGGYFKGAWAELQQVRWPTRRATWGLTLAVILFSAFFVLLVTLLDLGFKALFELIIN